MADISGSRVFTVDRFFGLNESADGSTELKLGEAAKCENFYITDNFNLKSRPGTAVVERAENGFQLLGFYTGNISGQPWTLTISCNDDDALSVRATYNGRGESFYGFVAPNYPVKVFPSEDGYNILYRDGYGNNIIGIQFYIIDNEPMLGTIPFYVPVVVSAAPPAGGGTALEKLNILTNRFRAQYSADGDANVYHLPDMVRAVESVTVDNKPATGTYDAENHTYTFSEPPAKGVNNVEFLCRYNDADLLAAREKFARMKHSEAFNGATDTRLFFYGDGSNVCFYTGTPAFGSGLYLPALNEIVAETSASPITGMIRHYSKLVGFQPDGAFVISYEPLTLEDGSVIAGFYMRSASREFGNEMDGQIQTVNNYPRTLCGGNLYEWRNTSAYYQDERYAKRISEKISRTLSAADPQKIVTCDNNTEQTYYMFLNDDAGTVLVNRYNLDAWTIYTGEVFKGIRFAAVSEGQTLFANANTVFRFDPDSTYDAPVEKDGEAVPVLAVWESGFCAFGADYRRKYSSRLWFSLLPEPRSEIDITVRTDKRDDYLTKAVGYSFLDFADLDFSRFSFVTRRTPQIRRVQIKVKKFVYYKLILRVTKPGSRATVLGYDQQIRYSSNVK